MKGPRADKVADSSGGLQMEIIAILKTVEEMSLKDIREHLPTLLAERTIRENLADLKKQGIVSSRGQARSTTWFLNNK